MLRVDRPEKSPFDPLPDSVGDERPTPIDDFLEVKPGNLREVVSLGNDQLRDDRERRVEHLRDEESEQPPDPLHRIIRGLPQPAQ